ncbi:MAG: MBL fold metallo-hydrolase [Ruminococcaceae bacterium]|nr:MBL fold metallo-hydrolase [Oscillospiraceae bacterium]
MRIRNLWPGGYASACYLVTEGETAVLIDCSAPVAAVNAALADTGTHLAAILLTHGHFDHILTLADVQQATGAPIYIHEQDLELPADGHKNAFTTFFGFDRSYPTPDRTFHEGDRLTFGSVTLQVLHTPGHTKGSSVFLADGKAFTGDTLFAAGYGRCDLYGGDFTALRHSLQRLSELPPDTVIYPGHGAPATVAEAFQRM